MKKYNLVFHAMDDSNELVQAITGKFRDAFCAKMERLEVSHAPNLRTYFKVRSYASKVSTIK